MATVLFAEHSHPWFTWGRGLRGLQGRACRPDPARQGLQFV